MFVFFFFFFFLVKKQKKKRLSNETIYTFYGRIGIRMCLELQFCKQKV
jgi:hypothetical protein